jgi:CPA1 family monovalent cation:H+ antiporter
MTLSIERVELLLLIAAFVAIVSRRFRLPYTVGLVLAGTALALFPNASELTLTKDLGFNMNIWQSQVGILTGKFNF